MEYLKKFWNKFNSLSKKRKTYVIVTVALFGVLLWAFCVAKILTSEFTRDMVQNGDTKQQVNATGIIFTETKENRKYWEMYGEKAEYTSDNKIALLENIVGNFYKDNEVSMSFESSKGTYNEEKNQIILYDNSFIVLKDGTTLKANRLTWSGSDKDIIAQDGVEINRNNDFFVTAEKVIISPDYNNFKVVGHTKTTIYSSKEK